MDAKQMLDVAQSFLRACNSGDSAAIQRLFDDDIAFDNFLGERVIGKTEFRAAHARAVQRFSPELGDAVIMCDCSAGRAAMEVTLRGTYNSDAPGLPPATGKSFSVPAGIFLAFDGERIVRITEYANLAEMARQVSDS